MNKTHQELSEENEQLKTENLLSQMEHKSNERFNNYVINSLRKKLQEYEKRDNEEFYKAREKTADNLKGKIFKLTIKVNYAENSRDFDKIVIKKEEYYNSLHKAIEEGNKVSAKEASPRQRLDNSYTLTCERLSVYSGGSWGSMIEITPIDIKK